MWVAAALLWSRRPVAIANVRMLCAGVSQAAAAADSSVSALLACGRRGRWKAALELLTSLEKESTVGAPAVPLPAYHSVLLACRKHKRHREAADVLRRMGDQADTAAYNEVLHLLRLRGDWAGAMELWERMAKDSRDSLSYYHILHMCGEEGRWQLALQLCDELRAHLGEEAFHSGHYLACMRACARDRRWAESVALARAMPSATLANDNWLLKEALRASSEAGEPDMAATIVSLMGGRAKTEHFAQWLVASRRGRDVESARAAWRALEASHKGGGDAADDMCFAVMIGTLLDSVSQSADGDAFISSSASAPSSAATPAPSLSSYSDPSVEEAMTLAARASEELPVSSASVVLIACLGSAISAAQHRAAAEALRILTAVDATAVEAGMQIKVLETCAAASDWGALEEETGRARERTGVLTVGSDKAHLIDQLKRVVRMAERAAADADGPEAAAAGAAAQALASFASGVELRSKDTAETADAGAEDGEAVSEEQRAATEAAKVARKSAQTRYSRSLAMPSEASVAFDVLYEDDHLLAVNKPIGVPIHPRHRFEARSMVNRAIAHLNGRTPYVLHRLDSPTSGVLLFGKTVRAAREINRQFRERVTEKAYLAVLLGVPADDSFEVDVPIATDPENKQLSLAVPRMGNGQQGGGLALDPRPVSDFMGAGRRTSTARRTAQELGLARAESLARGDLAAMRQLGAKESLTRFDVIARSGGGDGGGDTGSAVCLVRPLTGRMHQIRVHAEYMGHPLAGDEQYGLEMQATHAPECSRLLLHAHSLLIRHPAAGEVAGGGGSDLLRFTAPPPDLFAEEAAKLGLGSAILELQAKGGGAQWE